jgi:acetyl-CoA synthetase
VLALSPDDICFSVPKIFFAYGFGNTLTFPFAAGAAAVLMPGRPEPDAVFECVRRFRPTVFFGLPTLYTALIKDPACKDADASSVRLYVSAAEVLANEIHSAWRQRFGRDIVEGLGSTEVLHIYLSNLPGHFKVGSAGLRVPGYALRLVDSAGNDVGDGEEGILMVRGGSNAPAYWNQPDKTAESMRDGWIYTGDRFVRDTDGFHTFRGRADDLVKVSGQWVYPLEVELALADHPQVRECAVLAVELPDRRTTLKAFVTLTAGTAAGAAIIRDLQDFVKQRLLPYKYPRIVELMDHLPKTGTGKLDRQALRKRPVSEAETEA